MSSAHIREFKLGADDYAALAAIDTAVYPDYPANADDIRYEDENFDLTRYITKRYVAEVKGQIVGSGVYSHMPSRFHPQRFWMWVGVHPGLQRQGIGRSLYERILADLRALDAIAVATSSRETMAESLAFLAKRGFREVLRSWESRLDVPAFDPTPFQKYLDRVERDGIVLTPLAAERERDPAWLAKVYGLHTAAMADVPSHTPYTPPPLDLFRRQVIESPSVLLDGYYVAVDGDRYVGESYLNRNKTEPGHLYQGLTGVRREYRGRGLAMALKLKTIKYAREHGYSLIKTWNATVNEGMLAINARLGFVRQPAWIEFEKPLP
jgi:GNAT superfamily N-acetyltransferase